MIRNSVVIEIGSGKGLDPNGFTPRAESLADSLRRIQISQDDVIIVTTKLNTIRMDEILMSRCEAAGHC